MDGEPPSEEQLTNFNEINILINGKPFILNRASYTITDNATKDPIETKALIGTRLELFEDMLNTKDIRRNTLKEKQDFSKNIKEHLNNMKENLFSESSPDLYLLLYCLLNYFYAQIILNGHLIVVINKDIFK